MLNFPWYLVVLTALLNVFSSELVLLVIQSSVWSKHKAFYAESFLLKIPLDSSWVEQKSQLKRSSLNWPGSPGSWVWESGTFWLTFLVLMVYYDFICCSEMFPVAFDGFIMNSDCFWLFDGRKYCESKNKKISIETIKQPKSRKASKSQEKGEMARKKSSNGIISMPKRFSWVFRYWWVS